MSDSVLGQAEKELAMRAAWWWIDRWRNSTAYTDMTAEEQGLYRNLLDEIWLRDDQIIPDDDRILSRISGDHEAWLRCRDKVLRWMKKVPGGWTHATALEVMRGSLLRAQRQKDYRNKRRNADHNEDDNKAHSPSPSPSNGTRSIQGDRSIERRNPFMSDRSSKESEALQLTTELAELTDRDPMEVFAEASHYEGAKRTKVNPANMTDDRLAATILDLKANLKAEKEARENRAVQERIEARRKAAAK